MLDAFRHRRRRAGAGWPVGSRHPRSARKDSRQRGLLSSATAAPLPHVHRRTNAWPSRDIRSKNRSSRTSSTARGQTSMAAPIRSFASTRGGCATSFASITKHARIPSSFRLPKGQLRAGVRSGLPSPRSMRLNRSSSRIRKRAGRSLISRALGSGSRALALVAIVGGGSDHMECIPRTGGRSSSVASPGLASRVWKDAPALSPDGEVVAFCVGGRRRGAGRRTSISRRSGAKRFDV